MSRPMQGVSNAWVTFINEKQIWWEGESLIKLTELFLNVYA